MTNEQKYKTTEERNEAFHRFCKSVNDCSICPVSKAPYRRCTFAWLALEAEEEKPDACPCCGGEARIARGTDWARVVCQSCRLGTEAERTPSEAIAKWNRRAK